MSFQIPDLRPTTAATTSQNSAPTVAALSTASCHRSCCEVCSQNSARYACPRCRALYCSVACYRQHNGDGACTESFYQNRVGQVLRLEVKEKSDDMRGILNRVHRSQQHGVVDDLQHVSHVSTEGQLTREELLQLWSLLEKSEDNESELARVLSQQPPRLQAAVDRITLELGQSDTASLQEWILEPWYPWWRTELVSTYDIDECGDDEGDLLLDETTGERKEVTTLDEQILAVPRFDTLFRSKLMKPQLQYNIIDILYAVTGMLRQYHGAKNALEMPQDACAALVGGSAVLLQDARFESLDEVLMSCARRSEMPMESAGTTSGANDATPWTMLAQDVASLCQSHRWIARALFEACDVVKAAISTAKKAPAADANISDLRRIHKKLQFYLSWSMAYRDTIYCLHDRILDWIGECIPPSGHPNFELRLPNDASHRTCFGRRRTSGATMLEEVVSRVI